MSASALPSEVLQEIFRHLSGRDVAACRGVCRRWKHAVDSAGDTFWKEFCATEYNDVYEEAHRKAGLSWRELYQSLSMWPRVAEANIRICKIPKSPIEGTLTTFGWRRVNNFEILRNGILAFPIEDKFAYYNLATFKLEYYREQSQFILQNCEQFNILKFQKYFETENMIVLQLFNEKAYGLITPKFSAILCVFPKVNMKCYFVQIPYRGDDFLWKVHENQIFFFAFNDQIRRISLVERDNDVSVEDEVFVNMFPENYGLIDIVYTKSKQVNILTYDSVYTVIDKQLIKVGSKAKEFNEEFIQLKRHGFRWIRSRIILYLRMFYKFPITKYECQAIYANDQIVIIGTHHEPHNFRPMINIYCNPYGPNGELQIYDAEPDKSVYLGRIFTEPHVKIEKIDVVEVKTGHKLVLLTCDEICVIEFSHNEDSKINSMLKIKTMSQCVTQ